jgi:hypothetical protein
MRSYTHLCWMSARGHNLASVLARYNRRSRSGAQASATCGLQLLETRTR